MLRDDVRREVAEPSLLPMVLAGISHPHVAVRYASCQCARALTRSIHVLRTSVVDSGIGATLLDTVKGADEDRRVRTAALAGVCNLLNNYSPFREVCPALSLNLLKADCGVDLT
jgi:hypothetical protein